MSNKNNQKIAEKFHTINDFSVSDWVCFIHPHTNKKCTGVIVEVIIPTDDIISETLMIINYLDSHGLSGSIPVNSLHKNQRVVGIDMDAFFGKKFTMKNELLDTPNQTRKIAKEFVYKTNLKRTGNIQKN